MQESKKDTYQQISFDKIRIGLASPEKIREWSRGEVTKPETINYRTLKPEPDGLFCERIFGPSKDWECHCGKYKKYRQKGVICDKCGVEITKASVRRDRMGSIELASPVSHVWYLKGIPTRLGLILDIKPKDLDKVLYFASYVVLDPGVDTDLTFKQILSEKEYREAQDKYGATGFRAQMGAEAIDELLTNIDLEEESERLRKELSEASGQKKSAIIKRLETVEAFKNSGNRPEWMILKVLPVIPPDLRPMVQLDGGRFATSDLNDLYRRIINRNNRLKKLLETGAPEIILRNEKRMLQESVDSLIDNGRRGKPISGAGKRPLKSLSDMLKGKQGRFRQNLLGKRVDYSGRSVIVVGPELKIYQCGLPKEMAIELFKPYVIRELIDQGITYNVKSAKKMIEKKMQAEVWDILEQVIKEHPVMLNRAPTLHRLGIQAFEPILVEGKAIKLHPLVCTAFNADFDGDQMAVHLPLTEEAQAECRFLLLSPNNLLKPSDGAPVAVPSQDMVLGIYYLTQERPGAKGEGKIFKSVNEAILAYENKAITLHAKIFVRVEKTTPDGEVVSGIINTTLGRCLFNEILPQDLGLTKRETKEDYLKLEVDYLVKKKELKGILEKVINVHGATKTAEVLDDIKAIGYKYSTRAAMTVSVSDMTIPQEKAQYLKEAEDVVARITANYQRGFTTDEERYKEVIETWQTADDKIQRALMDGLDDYNNIYMMADSGARGSDKQIKQLAGMRGLMADTTGKTIELPITSNFREGLDVLEYFISAHGARKGLSDTALRTADSGYLTRRLVDVAQDLIVREVDCAANRDSIPFMEVERIINEGKQKNKSISNFKKEDIIEKYSAETIKDEKGNVVVERNQMITAKVADNIINAGITTLKLLNSEEIESLKDRITGRYSAETIEDENGEIIVKKNHMITPKRADKIIATGRSKVKIRTILSCKSHQGVCAKCYGANMATGQMVQVGEAVGIIAAQSIGEPGTQLTMRTFHTGGVAGGDITQGLPRVEELFEARKPKGLAIIAEFGGKAQIKKTSKKTEIVVTNEETGEEKAYLIPYGSRIKTRLEENEGVNYVEAGDELTEGSVNPHDILRIKGVRAVQDYMIREVQKVYRLQGVDINDKHIEVIVRQMLKKIKIEDPGDSNFLPGSQINILEFEEINEKLESEGKKPIVGTRNMLGITKASLSTDSFLSGASFQETTKVLTEAAISGKVDPLNGLKENVIIGKLIPVGTGMRRYRDVKLSTDLDEINVSEEDDDSSEDINVEE